MPPAEPQGHKNHAVIAMAGLSLAGILGLTAPFVWTQLRSPLPYMATPRRKVVAALQFIEERLFLRQQQQHGMLPENTTAERPLLHFIDLGSGDGDTVLTASSRPGWRATGVELNFSLWALSQVRRISWLSNTKSHDAHLIWGDFLGHSLQDANVVMIFCVRPLMPRIAQKIAIECAPGTLVMAYRFHLPIQSDGTDKDEPRSTTTNNNGVERDGNNTILDADLIYDREEMRIYELRRENKE